MKSRHERSLRSNSARTSASIPPTRFIPNFTELQEATKKLPDPDTWPNKTYTCEITVNNKRKTLQFTRKRINGGSVKIYRWIYDGKVLIRNRDI